MINIRLRRTCFLARICGNVETALTNDKQCNIYFAARFRIVIYDSGVSNYLHAVYSIYLNAHCPAILNRYEIIHTFSMRNTRQRHLQKTAGCSILQRLDSARDGSAQHRSIGEGVSQCVKWYSRTTTSSINSIQTAIKADQSLRRK